MKVLIVESDKLLADNLAAALKTHGHETIWCVELQSAIEIMDNHQPRAVVLDLALASRSGVEFLYELRSYPEWQNLPVIIWTDLSRLDIQQLLGSLEDLGATYYHKSTTRLDKLLQSLKTQTAA